MDRVSVSEAEGRAFESRRARQSFAKLGAKIEIAFDYGSVATDTERALSDVDVMIVGRLSSVAHSSLASPHTPTPRRPP